MDHEPYRPGRVQSAGFKRLCRALIVLMVGGFVLATVVPACMILLSPERDLLNGMIERYGRELEAGEPRERIEYMIGPARPHPSFPGWDGAYDLGSAGISFSGKRDFLLLKFEDGLLVAREIRRGP
jgi:hypothetical protein